MSLKRALNKFAKLKLDRTVEIDKEGTDELIRLTFNGKKIVVENIDTGEEYSTDKLTEKEIKEFYELLKDHPLNYMKSCGDWADKYNPQANHIDEGASYTFGNGDEGRMYETFGEELEYVLKVREETPERVWTLLEADGLQFVSAGYHHVNRLGYFITEKGWKKATEEFFVD